MRGRKEKAPISNLFMHFIFSFVTIVYPRHKSFLLRFIAKNKYLLENISFDANGDCVSSIYRSLLIIYNRLADLCFSFTKLESPFMG